MNTAYTPGRWHVVANNQPQNYPSGAAYTTEVWAHDGEQPVALATDVADATLLAAAPALLAALRAIIAEADAHPFNPIGHVVEHVATTARAALAAAEVTP